MKLPNNKKWLNVIEFIVVGTATWLAPSAGFLLFLLKLCFQILQALPPENQKPTTQNKPQDLPQPLQDPKPRRGVSCSKSSVENPVHPCPQDAP